MIEIRIKPDGRMRASSAAAYIDASVKTLAVWRCKGIGPKFIKRGGIWYFKADLDEWLHSGRVSSTAQARALKWKQAGVQDEAERGVGHENSDE